MYRDGDIDKVAATIVDAAIKLHMKVGPGLLESVYEILLAQELTRRGLKVGSQLPVAIELDGVRFEDGFRIDLLVEDQVVVELKSVEKLAPIHSKQLLTYLRLKGLELGLLINFGSYTLRDGLRRIVNNYQPKTSDGRLSDPI